MRFSFSRRTVGALAAAAIVASPLAAAHADGGFGGPMRLTFSSARVLPEMHAATVLDSAEIADGREYNYRVQGYFIVAGKTVARMTTMYGRITAKSERLTIRMSTKKRHAINAAARRHHTNKVAFKLVFTVSQTTNVPGGYTGTYSEQMPAFKVR